MSCGASFVTVFVTVSFALLWSLLNSTPAAISQSLATFNRGSIIPPLLNVKAIWNKLRYM